MTTRGSSSSSSRSTLSSWTTLPLMIVGAAVATVAATTLAVVWQQQSSKTAKRPVTTRPPKGKNVVSHLTIHCRNLEKSLKFYLAIGFVRVSGANNSTTTNNKNTGVKEDDNDNSSSILLSLPKGLQYAPYLLLKQATPTPDSHSSVVASPQQSSPSSCTMAGYGRMALLVPSVVQISNHLHATLAGIEPIAKPVTDMTTDREGRPMGRITIAAWKDPDGTVVELVETHNPNARRFLWLFHTLGAFDYPLWIHCNINATQFEASYKAYQQLGFEIASDFGRVKNKLYQALGIADPGIARQVAMLKMPEDSTFQLDLIQWEDPATVQMPKSKKKGGNDGGSGGSGRPGIGLTSFALSLSKNRHHKGGGSNDTDDGGRGGGIDRIPVGWETEGAAIEVTLPEPLGRARVKTLLDPDGTTVEIIEYL